LCYEQPRHQTRSWIAVHAPDLRRGPWTKGKALADTEFAPDQPFSSSNRPCSSSSCWRRTSNSVFGDGSPAHVQGWFTPMRKVPFAGFVWMTAGPSPSAIMSPGTDFLGGQGRQRLGVAEPWKGWVAGVPTENVSFVCGRERCLHRSPYLPRGAGVRHHAGNWLYHERRPKSQMKGLKELAMFLPLPWEPTKPAGTPHQTEAWGSTTRRSLIGLYGASRDAEQIPSKQAREIQYYVSGPRPRLSEKKKADHARVPPPGMKGEVFFFLAQRRGLGGVLAADSFFGRNRQGAFQKRGQAGSAGGVTRRRLNCGGAGRPGIPSSGSIFLQAA